VNSSQLKRAKRRVRREVLAARDAIPATRRGRLSERIAERFVRLPELAGARAAMAFWSFGSEVATEPLIRALLGMDIVVALPRIAAGDLEARTWRPGEPVTDTSFGAREPAGGTLMDPEEIDAIATPAVAFDRSGRRVGYGGGFYDRFFQATRPDALRVGVAFSVQLVDGDLPGGTFDARVDAIVTETETVRCHREP
jgi:5-formyltetrahydrofolate cyclo-ligase